MQESRSVPLARKEGGAVKDVPKYATDGFNVNIRHLRLLKVGLDQRHKISNISTGDEERNQEVCARR